MPPDLNDLTDSISLTPYQALGIPIALIGAVFLALGAQFQSTGVSKVEARSGVAASGGLNLTQLLALVKRPSWVIGTLMLGLAIVLQLVSLGIAPLIVVQPLGAVALVITAIVNSRVTKTALDRRSIRAIVICVGGVGLFVIFAAIYAKETPIDNGQLITILIILAAVIALFGAAFAFLRSRFKAIAYILGAGVLYGFVATLAKVVIVRIKTGDVEFLTMLCIVALLAAAAFGAYFVQTAYSSGPPDLVIAGLTVIDPLVAVGIGVIVLGEAAGAPPFAILAFVVSAAIAIFGVFQLAKFHPQIR
ncbi:DMT family transporter [Planctomonas psychrotolerans]|uniref:DMT family transporter n=1 Tax=Planctomonas psychrotolerans TaxID=2528712 RepID=UPI00123A4E66|nr:DMT family transporter [Planctomonas psychrotolerans]